MKTYCVTVTSVEDAVRVGVEQKVLEVGPVSVPGLDLRYEGGNPPWYIHKPNWFERCWGISWQDKIQRAVDKANQFIRAREREEEDAETAVKSYKEELQI